MKKNAAMISLITAFVIFATIGLVRREVSASSAFIAAMRGLVGGLCLVFVRLCSGKRFDFSSVKRKLLPLVLSGAAIGANWILLLEAYNHTSVATASLCYYLAPVLVVLFSPLVFKEKMQAKNLVCVLIALIGMVLVTGVADGEIAGGFGIVLALAAAVLYATVMMINRTLGGVPPVEKTVIQLTVAGLVALVYTAVSGGFPAKIESGEWLPLAVICFVNTGLAYSLWFFAMSVVKSETVAILSYIDPVVSVILSVAVLREPTSTLALLGTVLVIGALVAFEIPFGKRKKQGEEDGTSSA